MRKSLLSLLVGGLLTTSVSVQGQQAGVLTRKAEVGAAAYAYQVFVPAKLAGRKNLPVIVFLHGINQRGAGGVVPTKGASGALVRRYLEKVPAIVLVPQCRNGSYWTDAEMGKMVMQALDQTVAEFGADKERLYLTGVSMGGYGVWDLASRHPGKFAALIAICGGSPLSDGGGDNVDRFLPIARQIGRTPAWVFHGADDAVVPVSESRGMVKAMKTIDGNNVRYSEYAGVGHNVWLKALAETELLSWLLAQRLTK